jgi:hypothetical protein
MWVRLTTTQLSRLISNEERRPPLLYVPQRDPWLDLVRVQDLLGFHIRCGKQVLPLARVPLPADTLYVDFGVWLTGLLEVILGLAILSIPSALMGNFSEIWLR